MKVIRALTVILMVLVWLAIHAVWIYTVWVTPGDETGRLVGTILWLMVVFFELLIFYKWSDEAMLSESFIARFGDAIQSIFFGRR